MRTAPTFTPRGYPILYLRCLLSPPIHDATERCPCPGRTKEKLIREMKSEDAKTMSIWIESDKGMAEIQICGLLENRQAAFGPIGIERLDGVVVGYWEAYFASA